jgi:hypothetical protein
MNAFLLVRLQVASRTDLEYAAVFWWSVHSPTYGLFHLLIVLPSREILRATGLGIWRPSAPNVFRISLRKVQNGSVCGAGESCDALS